MGKGSFVYYTFQYNTVVENIYIWYCHRFGLWVEERKLQAFRGQVNNPGLKAYISQALKWEEAESKDGQSTVNTYDFRVAGLAGITSSVVFTSIDVRKMNYNTLAAEVHSFARSPLVFLDVPKVNKKKYS